MLYKINNTSLHITPYSEQEEDNAILKESDAMDGASEIVESEDKKVLIAGDQTMTRSEYINRTFSRWYPKQNLLDLNKSLDKVQKYKPDLVIPGHDRPFCP